MNRSYDLTGLRLIILGCVLSAIFVNLESFIAALAGGAALLLELAASFVSFAGILRLCDHGIRFRRARNCAALVIILGVVMNLMMMFVNGGDWMSTLNQTEITAPLVAITYIMLLVAGIGTCVCAYNLLYGCRDIANRQGNAAFAEKCRKAWLTYVCGLLLSGIVEVASNNLSEFYLLSAALFLASIVVELVVSIWVLLVFNRIYKLFHGQEIKELEHESKRLPKDSRGSEQYRG